MCLIISSARFEKRERERDAERLSGLHVEDQLDFRALVLAALPVEVISSRKAIGNTLKTYGEL